MKIGLLRHRVTILRPVQVIDDWGQAIETWEQYLANIPAEVTDIRGREYWLSGQPAVTGVVTLRVRIRWRADVTRQMRVEHDHRLLEISAVMDPDGRRTETHLMCQELS